MKTAFVVGAVLCAAALLVWAVFRFEHALALLVFAVVFGVRIGWAAVRGSRRLRHFDRETALLLAGTAVVVGLLAANEASK